MPDVIRKLVSGRKNRHVENGVNLDLTYITEKIIIMGYPASGVASLYRNDRYKVRDFLDDKHYPEDDCHYRVYNLVPTSENSYDPVFFRGHVSRFPFPDHHVPPLSLIPLMVSDAKAWLMEHPENVVVIHCKAGLGRSGTFACCLLLALDPSLTGATSLMEASETEAIQMVSDALFREQQGGEDSSSDFDNSYSRDDTSRSTSLSYSRQMNSSGSRLRISTDVGRPRSSLQVGRREESKEETRAEVSDRLKAVFDLHTSKRIKAPKEKRSVIPLSEQNSENQTNEIETGDSGVKMEASADRNTDTVKERSPRRVRSVKDIVSMVSNSGRSRSKSSTGTVVGRSPSQARQREEEGGGGGSSSQFYAGMGNASRSSFVSVEPHSLGASPRGMSTDMLPLSDTSFEGLADGRQPRIGNGNGPAWLEVDPSDQIRSSSRSRNRASSKSPTPKEPSTMNSHHPNQSTQSVNEINKSPIASKPGVSIPSQRRWVGYFARILSGEDARLTFSSPCGFASPLTASSNPAITSKTRRKIKITRISIDRKSTTKALPIRNDLSIQIGHYEDALVQRLETWESNARRRARAFGIHDPGAISPKAEDEDKEMDFNTKQHSSSSTSLSAMATRIQSHNGGGTETPSSFFSQDPRSQLFQSHSSSKLGGSNWSLKINPQTEADRARNFDWGESDGNGKQLVYGERLMETRRENLGEENDGKRLRYIFIPGDCDSDGPLQDQNKGDERREVLLSPEPRRKKSTIFGRKSKEMSRTGVNELPAVSLVPPTPPPPANNELQGFNQSSTSLPSPKAKNGGTNSSNPNLIIDPDREIMFKVLVGRTGATHSLLPDFTAAAWCWIIPSFEEPRELNKPFDDEDEDEGEGGERVAREKEWRKGKKNAVKVKKGSKTVVRLERNELDFRKDVLGVEALEVEWEWVEI